jgi:phage/plasmid-like protein (TIGR03299 family)
MSHNIDMTNDRANIAYLGSRKNVWHHLGQEMEEGQSLEVWAKEAGINWEAVKVNAYADLSSLNMGDKMADGRYFLVRNDTGNILGLVSDTYKIVQPTEVLRWFEDFIGVDDRFKMDVAGSLDGGKRIWATAKFSPELTVAGEQHESYLLMTTSLDGTMATINQATVTRVVCQNTLKVATSDNRAVVKTTHRSQFDGDAVARELAEIAQSYDTFKSMGDAMALHHMTEREISNFFKTILNIPKDDDMDDISTRKLNQFESMVQAYSKSVSEGAEKGTAWAALQGVTRYIDHNRSVRSKGEAVETARFNSAQFGDGAKIKDKAFKLLMPLVA